MALLDQEGHLSPSPMPAGKQLLPGWPEGLEGQNFPLGLLSCLGWCNQGTRPVLKASEEMEEPSAQKPGFGERSQDKTQH